mmetsp:Transcript_25013/g.73220  ORF Transcript_25013/g.73220 Transcript_25013/m.73220 type:complete len:306 (-) Transcript_25013:910-1827(-)
MPTGPRGRRGWIFDLIAQTLTLSQSREQKTATYLSLFLRSLRWALITARQKLHGLLINIVPTIPVSVGMFTQLQDYLWRSHWRVRLTPAVHNELHTWRQLIHSLAARLTHFYELVLHPPSWIGGHDAANTGMGGSFFSPTGEFFVWNSEFTPTTREMFITWDNPTIDLTIKDGELAAQVLQLAILSTFIQHLDHLLNGVGNISSRTWVRRISVSHPVPPLPSTLKWRIHTTLHRKWYTAVLEPSTVSMSPPCRASGASSALESGYQPIWQESGTLYFFLLLFAKRVCSGVLAAGGKRVNKWTLKG